MCAIVKISCCAAILSIRFISIRIIGSNLALEISALWLPNLGQPHAASFAADCSTVLFGVMSIVSEPNNPLVSVVIPAFNEERRLPQTLARVQTYLAKQNYQSELIVVDDG